MSSSNYRRRGRDQHSDDAAAKRPRRGQRKKHIYLVIEDWEMGYSIHKLDIDDLDSDARAAAVSNQQLGRLPEPCAIRIEAPVDRYPASVTAIGRKILFVTDRYSDEAPILIYDTETASLAIGPRPTPALLPLGHILFVPVDERWLYALNPRREDRLQCSFEVISRGPRDEEDEFRLSWRAERWSVESVPAPMPLGYRDVVRAYAVHPDGRTIFVSAKELWSREGEGDTTHSFDTRSSVWTRHGEWQLPFHGQGYYVDEVDAWVGLRRDGFLCSCAIPSRRRTAERPPDSKLGRKTLFRENPKRHVGQPTGATLTYMGDARFCLVECAARQGVRWRDASDGEVDGCVLHVTVFGVKYDKRGGLQTTDHHERSYLVSRYGPMFAAQTFWM